MPRPRPFNQAMLCAVLVLGGTISGHAAEGSHRIRDRGYNGQWTLALDELQPSRGAKPEQIPHAGTLDGLVRQAEQRGRHRGSKQALVLYPAGAPRDESTRRLLTDQVLVHLAPGVAPDTAVRAAGATDIVPVELLPDHYLLRIPGTAGALQATEVLRVIAGVLSAEPQLARQAARKLLPNDSYFPRQWHLHNTGQNDGRAGMDLKLTNVWEQHRGAGMVIGIVDDGLSHTHPDLAANYSAVLSHDFNDNDPDPAPDPTTGYHGTAVSGLAAGRGDNSQGVSGVAYQATLAGLRTVARPNTDANEAAAILHSNAFIHIKNNSWGGFDCPSRGVLLERPGPMLGAALAQGTATGRQGRGTLYVWAAGNGGGCLEDINYDGFANSIYVIPIGAVDDQGAHPEYSEPGACLVVCTPSGSPDHQLLTTTDLVGNDGINRIGVTGEISDRSYTQTFAGTSAAAPLASGALALVLQANTNLNWRDMKEILLRSATRVQPSDPEWQTNSAGIAHHHQLGAGLLNTEAAVQMAARWPGLGLMRSAAITATGLPRALADNDPAGVSLSFNFTNVGFRVEHVTASVNTTHPAWGDLVVTLTSPHGVESRLSGVHTGDPAYDYDNWLFSSVRHWGEHAKGTWTVRVADSADQDVGRLDAVQVRIYGTTPDARLTVARSGDSATLTLTSRAVGWTYAVERSENLVQWTSLTTVSVPVTGNIEARDNNPPVSGGRFYRARLLGE